MMRDVANRLEHMGCINRDIRLTIALTGPQPNRLAELRADFSFECNQLVNQLTRHLIAEENARLASHLLDQFVAMMQVLTRHQQHWTRSEIDRDAEGFVAATRLVHAAVLNFLEHSLDAIADTVRPPASTSAFAPEAPVRLTGTR